MDKLNKKIGPKKKTYKPIFYKSLGRIDKNGNQVHDIKFYDEKASRIKRLFQSLSYYFRNHFTL